jgi:hypothetical protein
MYVYYDIGYPKDISNLPSIKHGKLFENERKV